MTAPLTAAQFHDAAATIILPRRAFIDGAFCDASDGGTFANLNPGTGEALGGVAHCTQADVDRAVAAARRSFADGGWSRAAPEHRQAVLLKLAQLVREHANELAALECVNSGKTITDCLNEIGTEVPKFFQWYAELIDKSFGKVAPTGENALALIVKEPIGVVGLVLPWNFPLLMAAWKLAPALAAGCSVVLKPAEQTPLTALRLAELAAEAGVLNVLPGLGETTGQAIGRRNDIDAVSFTGSTEVGAMFLRYAADSNMKTVGLEMGGKRPVIVLDDAVLDDDLITNIVMAACWNGGQNCSANMRQIVHRSRKDEFVERVGARLKGLVVGDPLDPATEIGAMVTSEHRDRVLAYLAKGKQEGARIEMGGDRRADLPGFFLDPALFDGVTPEMTIAREEIFGPVLGVIAADSTEDALSSPRSASSASMPRCLPATSTARSRSPAASRPARCRSTASQKMTSRPRSAATRNPVRSRGTTAPRRSASTCRPRPSGSTSVRLGDVG